MNGCVEVGGSQMGAVTACGWGWAVQRRLVTTGHPQGARLKREAPAPLGTTRTQKHPFPNDI